MKLLPVFFLASLLGLASFSTWTLLSQDPNQPPPLPNPPPLQEGVEVETRGPVHEAFAEPYTPRPEASPVVPQQPPDPVEEMPPDQKPQGNDVRWIPGYWAWDDGGNNYVWVSGCWRDFPPGQVWVSGHWQQVQGGWQWAAGFWTNAQQQQLDYLPPPPPSIDVGPSAPAPADNNIYVPGCWIYQQTRYLWRPGFWIPHHPEWVWVPAHYVWSPGGCVFIEGYWDHPLHERGLLFAPCRLTRAVLLRRDFVFEPQYVVQPDFLIGALFVRPARHCYFFGDYFEDRYAQRGFVPWVDYRTSKVSYDPNFAYYRHAFARDRTWETNLRGLYVARRSGDVARPPTTLVQQTQVINNITVNKTQNVTVNKTINITNIQNVQAVTSITNVNNVRTTALASLGRAQGTPAPAATANSPIQRNVIKLAAVPKTERAAERNQVAQIREVASQRQKVEAGLLAAGSQPVKHTDSPRPVKIDLPKLAARPTASQPPAGKPPVPQPPAGKPPVTQPPAGKPPVTQPPAGKPPVTQPPAGKPPVGKPPAPSVVRTPPPPPAVPKHVEQPIPKHEPLKPSLPPAKAAQPPTKPAPPKQPPPQASAPSRPLIITGQVPQAAAKSVIPPHPAAPHSTPQHPPTPPKPVMPPHPAEPHTPVAPHVQVPASHPNLPVPPPKK